MIKKWTSVTLKGKSQVIPRVCPATLRPADTSLRYGYTGPLYFIKRTTYYQTFNYAPDAAAAVLGCLKYKNRRFWMWMLIGFILGPGSFVGLAIELNDHPVLKYIMWAFLPFWIAVGCWQASRMRRKAMARNPVPADAICWGPAAYYTGSGLSVLGNRAVYKALRPEWIKALVESNPEQVDDATYAQITGSARPVAGAQKPFG